MPASVHRIAQLLELYRPDHPEVGVSEVAGALKVSKSTAHELLSDLAQVGLLERSPARRYRLGWRFLALSHVLLTTTQWREEARRAMEELVERFGETTHLATLEGGRVVYVEKLEGTHAVQVRATAVGIELPAHCSALGKVLLGHQPWEETLSTAERHGLPALTPNTITSLEGLRVELNRVRNRGYAYDIEETLPGICCVAAPIRGHTGEVIAAMSLTVPAYRFRDNKETYRQTLLRKAQEVSARLGYEGDGGVRVSSSGEATERTG